MPKPKKVSREKSKLVELLEKTAKDHISPYLKAGIDMLTISWFLHDVEKGIVDHRQALNYTVGCYDQKRLAAVWKCIALNDEEL